MQPSLRDHLDFTTHEAVCSVLATCSASVDSIDQIVLRWLTGPLVVTGEYSETPCKRAREILVCGAGPIKPLLSPLGYIRL